MDKELLIKVDKPMLRKVCRIYFKWKELNKLVKNYSTRGVNMPDAISEPMGCYCMNCLWNHSTGGDALSKDGKKIEFKATSNYDSDLTSFGPDEEFDDLVFLRFDTDHDMLCIYDTGINSKKIVRYHVSKTSTFKNFKDAGKRPRFSIIDKIIKQKDLKPTLIFDIKHKKIIDDK